MTTFRESKREDLNMMEKMILNGWTPQFSYEDENYKRNTPKHPPLFSVNYVKGEVHAWIIGRVKAQTWRVADLRESHFINHRWYSSLEEVIKKE